MTKVETENFDGAYDDLQTALKFAKEINDVALIDRINRELRRIRTAQSAHRSRQSGASGRS